MSLRAQRSNLYRLPRSYAPRNDILNGKQKNQDRDRWSRKLRLFPYTRPRILQKCHC